MIANSTQSKRLHWYIVLAALTCFSTSPSTVEPKTIVAGSSAPKYPLGVVDQSDARLKRYLRTNSNTTKSMDGENEDRGGIPGSTLVSTIDHLSAAKVEESIEAKLREAAVIPEVSAKDHVPAANVEESVEKTVVSRTSVPQNIQDGTDRHSKNMMGDQIKFAERTRAMFKSDDFMEWSKSVDKAHIKDPLAGCVVKVSTLLATYDNSIVVSMLAAGRKYPDTQAIVQNLEIGLLTKWAADDNRVDDVIRLLTLGKNEREVWYSPLLRIWINFATKMGKKPLELVSKQFPTRYNQKELEALRVAANNDINTQPAAVEMVQHQLKIWKKSGISVIRSFHLLKLNEEHLATLLRSPVLSTWIFYVKMLGPDPYQVLLIAMRKHVGGTKLDSILAAAKADDTNSSIWRILLHMQEKHQLERLKRDYPQLEGWQRDGKSGDDVFDLLKLSGKGKYMFQSDEWNPWVAYLTFLEKQKHPKDQREIATVILSVLKNRFAGKRLAKLIARAKTVGRIKELSAKRSEWRIANKTPDGVFDLLKLKKKGDDVFESPEFKIWALYVEELNSVRSREDDVELAYQLYRHYGPDVERMLRQSEETAIAKNDEVTKAFVNNMRNAFRERDKKALEKKSLKEASLEKKSLEETSFEKKELGYRLRTSPPALATDSSKRRKILDESKSPTGNNS